jgi:peroxiredoxin
MKSARYPLAALLAAAALVLSACTGSDAVGGSGNGYNFAQYGGTGLNQTYEPAKRKAAGAFDAPVLSGGRYTLGQDMGKVLVLNFWATWCGPCKVETPQFDSVYRSYKAKGVQFLGIDTKDADSAAREFVKDNDITYPILSDQRSEIPLRIGHIRVLALPITVLLDKQGRVAGVYLNKMAAADLTPLLDKLLAE